MEVGGEFQTQNAEYFHQSLAIQKVKNMLQKEIIHSNNFRGMPRWLF